MCAPSGPPAWPNRDHLVPELRRRGIGFTAIYATRTVPAEVPRALDDLDITGPVKHGCTAEHWWGTDARTLASHPGPAENFADTITEWVAARGAPSTVSPDARDPPEQERGSHDDRTRTDPRPR